jgi:hypothetical protein
MEQDEDIDNDIEQEEKPQHAQTAVMYSDVVDHGHDTNKKVLFLIVAWCSLWAIALYASSGYWMPLIYPPQEENQSNWKSVNATVMTICADGYIYDVNSKLCAEVKQDNQWHNVAVVRNSTNANFYIDGIYNGTIDEIQMWNTSLTKEQLEDLYCQGYTEVNGIPCKIAIKMNAANFTGTFAMWVKINNGTNNLVAGYHTDEARGEEQ